MSKPKVRDEVWIEALDLVEMEGKFKARDLEVDAHPSTIRDVLNVLEDAGWLQRYSDESRIWRAGPKAKGVMDIPEDSTERAVEK